MRLLPEANSAAAKFGCTKFLRMPQEPVLLAAGIDCCVHCAPAIGGRGVQARR
jgi:hypothetical protein